jgi:Ser/Thr protein kinase RdoA (MazF antagonist)
LVIHGDFAPHNLLFYGKQLISILDFGDACLNLKAIDVARGLTTLSQKISAYTGRFHIDPSLAKEFLQTYQDQQPGRLLSAEEIKSVPDLIRWRLIQPFIWRLNRSLAK